MKNTKKNVLDPMFYYHASWACSKMKLKSQLAEYVAVGMLTVLVDMPYDINGATYVHWIWHDTDPNICMYLKFTSKLKSTEFIVQGANNPITFITI